MSMSPLSSQLFAQLFPNGGECYSYTELKRYLESWGATPKQVLGVLGYCVSRRFLFVARRSGPDGEAIFTR